MEELVQVIGWFLRMRRRNVVGWGGDDALVAIGGGEAIHGAIIHEGGVNVLILEGEEFVAFVLGFITLLDGTAEELLEVGDLLIFGFEVLLGFELCVFELHC